MPTYEYECKKCGVFEVEQRITEPALTKCPQCKGKQSVQRILSAPAFHLKGGGWYKDLYSSVKPADKSAESAGKTESVSSSAEVKSSDLKIKTESNSKSQTSSQASQAATPTKKSDKKK